MRRSTLGARRHASQGEDSPIEDHMRTSIILAATAVLLSAPAARGQDTSFAGVQKRGKQAMGVDQYT